MKNFTRISKGVIYSYFICMNVYHLHALCVVIQEKQCMRERSLATWFKQRVFIRKGDSKGRKRKVKTGLWRQEHQGRGDGEEGEREERR